MSLLDSLDPILIPWAQDLFDLAQRAGVHPKVTSARRSTAKQASLYSKWKSGQSLYPAAPPGNSAHEYGLAFDMVVPSRVDQIDLGTVWVGWQGKYGGEEDPIHFEFPNWRSRIGLAPAPPQRNIRTALEEAVDLALSFLPTPVRGIVNTAQLATSIWSLSGRSESLILSWLAHPQEYFDAVFSVLWGLVRSYYS